MLLQKKISPFDQQQINNPSSEEETLSVTQLANLLKRHVESHFNHLKVKAEISGYKKHTSGHAYFTLKDADTIIDAVIWRGTPIKIDIEDGMKVIVYGKITTYPMRSKYQMIIEKVEPAGQGDLMRILLERKEKFQKLGYFEKKSPLPFLPQKIGVITSETGAVIRDILHRIQDRYPCHVVLYPSLVQGNGAAEQVAKGVDFFNNTIEHKPDIIIVARGGGSLEDLWAFNEEVLIESIYQSKIPVISAVGHETDITLCDYVADLRAPTPTAAAELATPVLKDIKNQINQLLKRMHHSFSYRIENHAMRYQLCSQRLYHPQTYINEKFQKLDDWTERFSIIRKKFLQVYEQHLINLSNRLLPPKRMILNNTQLMKLITQRFYQICKNDYTYRSQMLSSISNRLNQSSYQKTLEKGFCLITNNQNQPLKSIQDVAIQQNLHVVLHDGSLETTIQKINSVS